MVHAPCHLPHECGRLGRKKAPRASTTLPEARKHTTPHHLRFPSRFPDITVHIQCFAHCSYQLRILTSPPVARIRSRRDTRRVPTTHSRASPRHRRIPRPGPTQQPRWLERKQRLISVRYAAARPPRASGWHAVVVHHPSARNRAPILRASPAWGSARSSGPPRNPALNIALREQRVSPAHPVGGT